jgi:divalent metal cation (Fe/Co/Zn/Cd) transporter
MDASVPKGVEASIREFALGVDGVEAIDKCRVRKSGMGLMMDIHIVVDGDITVRRGHEIGHEVQRRLYASDLGIHDAIIHVEPFEER